MRLLAYHRLAGSKYASIARPNTMPLVDSPTREHLESVAARLRQGRSLLVPIAIGV